MDRETAEQIEREVRAAVEWAGRMTEEALKVKWAAIKAMGYDDPPNAFDAWDKIVADAFATMDPEARDRCFGDYVWLHGEWKHTDA